MADQGEGEHPFDVGLGHRAEHPDQHGQQGRPHQQAAHRAAGEQQRLQTDDRVDADLGEQPGEERRRRSGRGRIGVGQPCRHREDRGLDHEDQQQQQLHQQLDVLGQHGEPLGELGGRHGAGRAVGHRDPDQEQHRRRQPYHHVGRARPDAGLGPAEGEQHVGPAEQHLERDEEVEQVTGEEGVRHSGDHDEVGRVEDRQGGGALLVGVGLRDGVDHHAQRHRRGDHQHQRGEPVGDQGDADRRTPASGVGHQRPAGVGRNQQDG